MAELRKVRLYRERRGEGGRQQRLTGLTLHPLFPFALLFVLLLEFGYQARVHIPGLRNGTLLVLLYTGRTKPDQEAVEGLPWFRPERSEVCTTT